MAEDLQIVRDSFFSVAAGIRFPFKKVYTETDKSLDSYRVWRENLYTLNGIYFVKSRMNTTETCNTAIEWKFCGLSEDNYENCQKICYEA